METIHRCRFVVHHGRCPDRRRHATDNALRRQPRRDVIGPPNSSNLYQANKGLLADNPFIQTSGGSYVSWTIHFSSGVTALTNVTRARLSFNTAFDTATELDLTSETPEPLSVLLSVSGLLLLVARRFLPVGRPFGIG